MTVQFNPQFQNRHRTILNCIENFESEGEIVYGGNRNTIKIFAINNDLVINVKAFKIPKFFNQFIYRYIRKSKAQRSFENANYLIEKGFHTPQPIAFVENNNLFGLQKSYYISEQLQMDLMFRELTTNIHYPDFDEIVRQFARFSFQLHEKGIEFIDNTSGNTLIKKENGQYNFYLVDLNRMNFHEKMSFELRMKNLSKLTSNDAIIKIISEEYAILIGKKFEEVYSVLKNKAEDFQYRFHKRRDLKRKIFFWRKK